MAKLENIVDKITCKSSTTKYSLLHKIALKETDVKDVDCSLLSIRSWSFDAVNFTGGVFKTCEFFFGSISDCSFHTTVFSNVEFLLPFFDEIIFDNCTFIDVQITGGDFIGVVFNNCALQNVKFTTRKFDTVTYFENVLFKNCQLDDVEIEFNERESGDLPQHSGIKLKKA